MIQVLTCLTTQHDLRMVALAALVCLITVFTGFVTFGRTLDPASERRMLWLLVTGFCTATGIWATHFVAMLAYDGGLPISYEPVGTAASFVVALMFNTLAFWLLSQVHARSATNARPGGTPAALLQNRVAQAFTAPDRADRTRLLSVAACAGALASFGISLMHFTGMAAVIVGGRISWDWALVVSAIVFGMMFGAASFAAHLSHDRRVSLWGAPILLVLAIVAMHFTAMGAITIVPDPTIKAPEAVFDNVTLALAIAALTIAVLFSGFTSALVETMGQNRKLSADLARKLVELKEAQDDIVRKGRMAQLGNLTATVAHEIRNPLGSIRTSSFLLQRKLQGKGLGVDAQIERINSGIARCDGIITQLLDFARTAPPKLQTSGFDAWLETVFEEEASLIPPVVAIACDLYLGETEVAFDTERLRRVIINLMSNASEAMVGKGDDPAQFAVAAPRIHISTKRNGAYAEFRISDNGPGMTSEVLDRIREPLFTTKSFGTGLGIPAVEKIVEQHGGTLKIESAPGQGTTVIVRLPLAASGQLAA